MLRITFSKASPSTFIPAQWIFVPLQWHRALRRHGSVCDGARFGNRRMRRSAATFPRPTPCCPKTPFASGMAAAKPRGSRSGWWAAGASHSFSTPRICATAANSASISWYSTISGRCCKHRPYSCSNNPDKLARIAAAYGNVLTLQFPWRGCASRACSRLGSSGATPYAACASYRNTRRPPMMMTCGDCRQPVSTHKELGLDKTNLA
jgi:hypothetical protein